jgi:hypothetical protein
MESNETLLQFIKADWLAKGRSFELALRNPFPVVVEVRNIPPSPQLPLPLAPCTGPVRPSPEGSQP